MEFATSNEWTLTSKREPPPLWCEKKNFYYRRRLSQRRRPVDYKYEDPVIALIHYCYYHYHHYHLKRVSTHTHTHIGAGKKGGKQHKRKCLRWFSFSLFCENVELHKEWIISKRFVVCPNKKYKSNLGKVKKCDCSFIIFHGSKDICVWQTAKIIIMMNIS